MTLPGPRYTIAERNRILQYIIENSEYFRLRGRCVWQSMEAKQICPGRTWQSLKQHFQTHIIENISNFKISKNEVDRILTGYYRKRKIVSETEKQCTVTLADDDEDLLIAKQQKLTSTTNKEPALRCSSSIAKENRENIDMNVIDLTSDTDVDDIIIEDDYTEDEDKKIIMFIKNNMKWSNLNFDDNLYNRCIKNCSLNHTVESVKKRFLTEIVPNIWKYEVLNLEETLLFYDRAGLDVPVEMETYYSNASKNVENNDEIIVLDDDSPSTTDHETTNVVVSSPEHDSKRLELETSGNYVCYKNNNKNLYFSESLENLAHLEQTSSQFINKTVYNLLQMFAEINKTFCRKQKMYMKSKKLIEDSDSDKSSDTDAFTEHSSPVLTKKQNVNIIDVLNLPTQEFELCSTLNSETVKIVPEQAKQIITYRNNLLLSKRSKQLLKEKNTQPNFVKSNIKYNISQLIDIQNDRTNDIITTSLNSPHDWKNLSYNNIETQGPVSPVQPDPVSPVESDSDSPVESGSNSSNESDSDSSVRSKFNKENDKKKSVIGKTVLITYNDEKIVSIKSINIALFKSLYGSVDE